MSLNYHAKERSELAKRILPQMTLAQGDHGNTDTSKTNPYRAPRDSAAGRFALSGHAVITGGTGSIGLVVARAMLQHGIRGLMIIDLHPTDSVDLINELREDFPAALILSYHADVTDDVRVGLAVNRAVEMFGSVEMLVCFAGVVGAAHALDMPVREWRQILNVNTTGAFICAQAVARHMVAQGKGGRIIMTASLSAHRVGFPQPQAAYNTSKAALLMLKSSLAAEWARYGITVNSISPGYIDTILNEGEGLAAGRKVWAERNPMGRMGLPEEIAGVVVMLCSRAGSYMNGADIIVDGGSAVF
ncbi:Sorbose reductase SOU1 [Cladobotryum mycophilum]|uniref:Sorbose reductase SOU1 n=1 Tax=Cladobotryum mycophilum TaxID=491253 RepID=A0ABR0SXM9_9HYPO